MSNNNGSGEPMISDEVRAEFDDRIHDMNSKASDVFAVRSDSEGGHGLRFRPPELLFPWEKDIDLGEEMVAFWEKGDEESAHRVIKILSNNRDGRIVGAHLVSSEWRSAMPFETRAVQAIEKTIEKFKEGDDTEAKKKSISYLRESAEKSRNIWNKIGEVASKTLSVASTVIGSIITLGPTTPVSKPFGVMLMLGGIWGCVNSWRYYRLREWWKEAGLLTADMFEAEMDAEDEA